MSLTRAVAWNTAIQVVGRLVGLAVSVALTAILTRHLGLADYGQFVAASGYVALFTVLGDAGIYLVAVRRAAQEPERRAELLGTALGLRLVLAFVPLLLAFVFVQFVPTQRFPTYALTLRLVVAILAVNGYITLLNQFLTAVFRLHLRMDLAVIGEMLARLVTLAVIGLVVLLHAGLVAAAAAFTAGTLANFIYAWNVGRRFETFRPQLDRRLSGEMLRESVVMTAVTLLGLLHFKVDTLLLWALRPPLDVGIYGVAYKAHEVLVTFPGLFVGLLFPVFSRLAREDPMRLRQVFQRTFDVLVTTSLGAALLVFVLAPDLAALLGGAAASRPMRILAFALPPVFVSLGFTHLLLAESRQRWLVPFYLVLVAANVGGNLVAIQRWSYMGAAGVTVATEGLAVVLLAGYWVQRRRMPLGPRSLLAVPLAAGLAALGAAIFAAVPPAAGVPALVARLAVGSTLALGLYAAGVLVLGILPASTLRSLWPGAEADRSSTAPPDGPAGGL